MGVIQILLNGVALILLIAGIRKLVNVIVDNNTLDEKYYSDDDNLSEVCGAINCVKTGRFKDAKRHALNSEEIVDGYIARFHDWDFNPGGEYLLTCLAYWITGMQDALDKFIEAHYPDLKKHGPYVHAPYLIYALHSDKGTARTYLRKGAEETYARMTYGKLWYPAMIYNRFFGKPMGKPRISTVEDTYMMSTLCVTYLELGEIYEVERLLHEFEEIWGIKSSSSFMVISDNPRECSNLMHDIILALLHDDKKALKKAADGLLECQTSLYKPKYPKIGRFRDCVLPVLCLLRRAYSSLGMTDKEIRKYAAENSMWGWP